MAKYAIDSTTLTGIADAIREKDGSTDLIPVNAIAERIRAISAGQSKVKTGSFFFNNLDLKENPREITGVGFKPKSVYIYASSFVQSMWGINVTTGEKVQAITGWSSIYWDENANATWTTFAIAEYEMARGLHAITAKASAQKNWIAVTPTDDGFILSTDVDVAEYPMVKPGAVDYIYFAFG